MTPKEKAKELVGKFNIEHLGDRFILYQTVEESKRCALIAVDEILEVIAFNKYDDKYWEEEDYWNEVQNEINQL